MLFGRGGRVCGVVDSGSLHEVLELWVLHVVDCVEWGYSWQHHSITQKWHLVEICIYMYIYIHTCIYMYIYIHAYI